MNLLETFLQESHVVIVFKILTILVAYLVLKFVFSVQFKRQIGKLSKIRSIEERRVKRTRLEFSRVIISSFLFLFAIISVLFLIPGFKTFTLSLLAGAGIAAIIIGFAAQKTLSNIVSGLSIAIFAPFRIGDRIKVGEEYGEVEDLNLRHTIIKTWDNRRVVVPNSLISERDIINYSIKEEKLLWTVNMGISYDSDIDTAKKIMTNLAKKHPDVLIPVEKNDDGEIEKKEPKVRVTECGDFAVNLRLYFWVEKPSKAWGTGFDLTEQIKKEFDRKGIEIPFPYRTLVYKNDLEKEKKKKGKGLKTSKKKGKGPISRVVMNAGRDSDDD